MNDVQRLNVRVSNDVNNWLDAESKKTGIPKSSLVQMILSDYIEQKEFIVITPEVLKLLKDFLNDK